MYVTYSLSPLNPVWTLVSRILVNLFTWSPLNPVGTLEPMIMVYLYTWSPLNPEEILEPRIMSWLIVLQVGAKSSLCVVPDSSL